jgi:hypothetical protein
MSVFTYVVHDGNGLGLLSSRSRPIYALSGGISEVKVVEVPNAKFLSRASPIAKPGDIMRG